MVLRDSQVTRDMEPTSKELKNVVVVILKELGHILTCGSLLVVDDSRAGFVATSKKKKST